MGQHCYAEETTKAGWFLFNHRALGEVKAIVSDNAVKVYLLNNGTELVAKAPDWHVVISRPAAKIGMEYSLKKWKTKSIGMLDGKPPAVLQYDKKTTTENPYGVPVTVLKGYARVTETKANYVVLKSKTPTEVNAILIRLFRLPQVDGLPLAYNESSGESYMKGETLWLNSQRALNASRRSIRVLVLNGIKTIKVSPHEFDYPKGLKMTNDERDILITTGKSEMMNALTNFGMNDALPKDK